MGNPPPPSSSSSYSSVKTILGGLWRVMMTFAIVYLLLGGRTASLSTSRKGLAFFFPLSSSSLDENSPPHERADVNIVFGTGKLGRIYWNATKVGDARRILASTFRTFPPETEDDGTILLGFGGYGISGKDAMRRLSMLRPVTGSEEENRRTHSFDLEEVRRVAPDLIDTYTIISKASRDVTETEIQMMFPERLIPDLVAAVQYVYFQLQRELDRQHSLTLLEHKRKDL